MKQPSGVVPGRLFSVVPDRSQESTKPERKYLQKIVNHFLVPAVHAALH